MDSPKEIEALISLLDDPDDLIFEQVSSQLEKLGVSIIPALESACENHTYGPLFEERAEELIRKIQNSSIVNSLSNWVQSDDQDLVEGLICLAEFQYGEIDRKAINEFFDKIEKDIWLELNDELTALEKLKVINHILFDVHEFTGNRDDYHHADNSFINKIIETKTSNPIGLSCIYLILAKRLKLPIFGINLPRHFILGWGDVFSMTEGKQTEDIDILFYINPFSEGAVFGKQDISAFLKEVKIDESPTFFRPCSHVDIIYRTLNNLEFSYVKTNQAEKAEQVRALKQVLK